MNDERTQFALTCRDGDAPAPVLEGVCAEGRLDAVLFGLTLRQTYRNTSDRVLEVVYTFPLPFQAVLLGFASELNGERQEGLVVAKREAERQYEESLEEGDAPVMLEAHADGFTPKVLDFGIAQLSDARLTAATDIMGTPTYMAPECFMDARRVGPPADVWALGCLLYRLMFYKDAYEGPLPTLEADRAGVRFGDGWETIHAQYSQADHLGLRTAVWTTAAWAAAAGTDLLQPVDAATMPGWDPAWPRVAPATPIAIAAGASIGDLSGDYQAAWVSVDATW